MHLTGPAIKEAISLFEAEIEGVDGRGIVKQRALHAATAREGRVHADSDIWLGTVRDGLLAGAVHLSPDLENIVMHMIPRIGQPGHPDAEWIDAYGRECLQVQELAVARPHRRQGLAVQLLREAEHAARDVGARSLHGFADERNAFAVGAYRSAGYTALRL